MSETTNQPPFDEAAREIVRARARRLVGRAGLHHQDQEDLEQELLGALAERWPAFDPARGRWPAFAQAVVDNAARDLLRRARAGHRALGRPTSLEGLPAEARDEAAPAGREGQGQRDLAIDVRALLARLGGDLRQLAERLQSETVSGAARALGLPRTTVAGRVRQLRRRFEEAGLGPDAENRSSS